MSTAATQPIDSADRLTRNAGRPGEVFTTPVLIAIFGLACLPVGLLWDISHHSSIGRDTFWTPAHIIIQLGGIIPAMLFAWVALRVTFFGSTAERDASVSFFGARAPIGVWVTIWGAVAMVSSAPFDDWWHNTYGLDVKIASPPHAVLGLGMFGVAMGVLLFVFSAQNRLPESNAAAPRLVCAAAVGVLITLWADFVTEFSWPNLQHAGKFYFVVSVPFPLLLVLSARASRVRLAATLSAAIYTALYIGMILLLPLVKAQPKLAPIYHPVDHLLPPAFPLLLIAPALAIDGAEWVFQRISRRGWWKDWLLSAVVAVVFVAVILAVQWPFSKFLLSDAADNRFFARSGHWPYFAQPGDWMNTFWDLDRDAVSVGKILGAMARALVSARIGLWLGSFLLRLKR